MTFTDAVRMLRDKDGWHLAHPNVFPRDKAVYRDGTYIYADCGGITFRSARDEIVYVAGIFAFAVTSILTWRLRRYLKEKHA